MPTDRRKLTSEELIAQVTEKVDHYDQNGFPEARAMHDLIMAANPALHPRLWYGMPGYAKTKDSAVLCFFRKDDLISFGVSESISPAALAQVKGGMFPSAWYIRDLDEETRQKITQVVIWATQ